MAAGTSSEAAGSNLHILRDIDRCEAHKMEAMTIVYGWMILSR
jgi:hypothetical protein